MADQETEELRLALLAEPLSEMPEELSVADFERFTLKVALHAIRADDGPTTADGIQGLLYRPEVLALAIKEKIIDKLPDGYVTGERHRGLGGPDHVYSFTRPVPRALVMTAAEDSGVVEWT